ncbi:F0F1 ATP synthase subunit B [Mediterraneibacter catenae]|uniref:ATP synthase subunit b n=1 Tax=Mediterraneibacter catenae TaxID=2594882 RepID=A0A5M9I3P9_9FIRM|nr:MULTISPECIES: F0F1 ATP synthase subunit B [Mediterraneibacter]OUO30789.1 ATP synthase F0 subunit B [Lachnoclostridium sp. An298]HJA18898.1 F0F1 ATP synthase subunit B [Candidatus Mediterraneibacter ornithocaccae]KAA8502261.1 F0F1 ATP synthase subunit B [Mediterraneibacter catenae]MCF2568665.1 F0F1 ATP synthase subunit B [Mediterraneibacter glycyrrhizinilyticus]MDN0042589.1 F0F1 ATP synthase subunit B [Mediterraneibacter glycyrrhizinilyticus]
MISIDLNLVWTIINLVVLYLLLKHFLIGPVMNIMEQRKLMIEEGFRNAQTAQDDANRLKQEYETALSGAKQESVQLIEDARKSAKAEYDRIIIEAGEKADTMLESAKESVRVEREQTMKELKSQIAGLAAASAAKIISGNADEKESQDLYDQFLKEAGENDGNADK